MQSQVPEYILKVLRKQLNLEQDDTSHDEEILKLPAFEKLNKYVDWRLGKSVLTDFLFNGLMIAELQLLINMQNEKN